MAESLTQQVVDQQSPVHPLLLKKPIKEKSWEDWLNDWEKATYQDDLLSLLHTGFQTETGTRGRSRQEEQCDRITFYFSIAHDYDNASSFCLREERAWHEPSPTKGDMRQKLASKAFDMLCGNLFKEYLEETQRKLEYQERFWDEDISVSSGRIFTAVQEFFHCNTSTLYGHPQIANISTSNRDRHSHTTKRSIEFLMSMIQYIFTRDKQVLPFYYGEEQKKKNEGIQIIVDRAKPWALKALDALNELEKLIRWNAELTPELIAEMEKTALEVDFRAQDHFDLDEKRKARTVEEAFFLNSKTARFLIHWKIRCAEEARLQEIRKAQELKRDEEIRKREISAAQEEVAEAAKKLTELTAPVKT